MKKDYITSMKGIACLFVAFGHFLGIIKYASRMPLYTGWLTLLKSYQLDFLLNESFWLYLFFVVSGYLVANSKVENQIDLFVRCVTRFLRLALPILSACFVIYLFSKVIPFYNADTKAFFENNWFQSAFSQKFSFVDVILSPVHVLLLKKTLFNSPYWVLRSMMIASFVIYFITYINSKIKSPRINLFFRLLILIAVSFFDKIIFSCTLGALLCYYEKPLQIVLKSKISLYLCGVVSIVVCFVNDIYGAILFFSWLTIAMIQMPLIKKAIESKPFRFFGEISFGIYSFHWPILCSIGSLLIIKLWNVTGGKIAIFISMVVSMVATIAISIVFHYVIEKQCEKIVSLTRKKLLLFFEK